jgi:hypothetical protein
MVLELATGLFGGGVVLALTLSSSTQLSALTGVAVALVFGLLALVTKSFATTGGHDSVKDALKVQGIAMGLRLVALLLGGLVVKQRGLDPMAFVLAFAAVAMVQQVIEVRFLLAAKKAPASAR